MKFRSVACPLPSKGVKLSGKKLVVPDQSLPLREILERFTRHEALPIGHKVDWGGVDDEAPESELDVDLEKLAHADLTEKDEFREKVLAVKSKYEEEEKARREKLAADKKAADEKKLQLRIAREARKLAKKPSA